MPNSRLILNGNLSASNRIARQINRKLIFNQIRVKQPISRAELARTSGLQRSTVSLIVEELLTDRWVVEGSTGAIPRGRKPTFLNVNDQRGVLALDIHPAHAMLAVTDLGGNIVSLDSVKLPADPHKVIRAILNPVQKMLRAHPNRTFEGVGINVPGRFDPGQEKSIFAPNVGWPIGELKSRVEKSTGLSVVIDNVANACALSEVWFGYSDRMHDLVVVNVSEGIGTGIFANGHLLRGEAGVAGEFGHVQLDPNGVKCGCGGRGCWETIASNRAGVRYYAEIAKKSVSSFDDLIQLAKANDAAAKLALTKMCSALGLGMHMIALALAPGEIVVVGDITNIWELAGPAIESQMRHFPLVRAPSIRPAREGSRARLRSAVALIMNSKVL
ncbi:ROK family protein [Telmatobacter sp. DSM 110680]|uniref:ROK family protein n=1 Tax=Telmatobacter sp. DSM 110680 TaxID=3036704 RepID=A0AAU7DH32_9BACT